MWSGSFVAFFCRASISLSTTQRPRCFVQKFCSAERRDNELFALYRYSSTYKLGLSTHLFHLHRIKKPWQRIDCLTESVGVNSAAAGDSWSCTVGCGKCQWPEIRSRSGRAARCTGYSPEPPRIHLFSTPTTVARGQACGP